jgi:hypothetical protein
MDNKKLTILIIAASALLALLIIALAYFVFRSDSTSDQPGVTSGGYPQSVQDAIGNPLERNGDWLTLVSEDDFQISYVEDDIGRFMVTVNNYPLTEVSQRAELALLQKLQIDQDYACKLPVFISVPSALDDSLSQYSFGLSFCDNRMHITDVQEETPTDSNSSQFNSNVNTNTSNLQFR